ncbi:putative porin [Pseudomonas sp. CCI3.2]|uniref:putative porin n=1 Tax=unclassified Pseudomonas TaxID=196821 RepID=UPI002AC89D06|nr:MULTISPECIES: putative porin [unclassified Pseudomonas]MEB0078537.1 putative porin [Pseudomonas sp. MH10out]MEB0092163.1 putative porin [Pseudomonas sp. CCI4.2]MEB0100352.1 putative porin [Pseudomonas sp. CCI3.2]MEB0132833.1 putative porin [Pseudomonas sp. CCI2.4]MEB0159138.1 putative porin [Pseudomonas sp. AH2 (2023)]
MRFASTKTATALYGGLLLAISVPASAAVDAKLLEMLKANGSISAAQFAELQTELSNDQQAQQLAQQQTTAQIAAVQTKSADYSAFEQKIAWAAKTQFKGDVRVRQETVKIDGQTNSQDKDRQRIRARLGAYTEINPQVSTGIRIATGSSNDARSTNQDLDGYFVKKDLWLDQGYIDYHPTAIKNLHVIGGKMSQPWVSMGDIIWDADINPEGLAATYSYPVSKNLELFGSAGNYTLKDNIDGDGTQFKNDLRLNAGQLGARFAPIDTLKVTLGGSVYQYQNDKDSAALSVNGNNTNRFRLLEGFGQVDIGGLAVPLSVYGQYVVNNATDSDEDTGWLTGVKTKVFGFGLDYNYRDTQRNAVVGAFTDSDFANGTTGSRGHKLKVSYDIDKNFAVGATYFLTKADYAIATQKDADANTLQLDVEAKF